ncbi:TonB-dependent siderophore receptor [Pseudomonas sp. NA-150]|uniref:TonB-dependent siderophore receptor n=1 Tax=Pseudomonas sp. NA-150 TaxID=3367525 RepID=UPI0037C81747
MSRSLHTLMRPSLLALSIALTLPLASTQTVAAEQASTVRAYNLPAGSLSTTLNQIASQSGLALSLDPSLAAGRTSAPVQGQFDATGALRQALRGTGLQLVQSSAGTFSVIAVPDSVVALPETSIQGRSDTETAWGPVSGYTATRTAAGTKTDTPILETPRSISVVTRQQMEDRAVQNLDDALRYTPGVIASSYGSDTRADWLRVRGFVPTQFLDGLPLPAGSFANPKIETWDLERVALLRGPSSSVYGQTPPGGMLDMVSRRPDAEDSHEVQLKIGSNQRKQISFDSTGKIDDDGKFLYRIDGVVRDGNTPIDHIDDKRYNIAPSLTWNIDPDTHLTFLSQFTHDDTGVSSQFLPLNGTKLSSPVGNISHHTDLGEPNADYYHREYYALGYAFDHRFNDVWQFHQNVRYTKSDLEFHTTYSSYAAGALASDGTLKRIYDKVDEDISQFAMDNNFQADFDTGPVKHTVLLGADVQHSNTNYHWIEGDAPSINVSNPIYGQPYPGTNTFTFDNYNQKTTQTGVYAQDQMALDKWRLTLGGREDWVHTGTEFHNFDDATHTERDSKFSGNAGISYVFDTGITPYVSYAESFQPTSGAAVSTTESFKPTSGKQYEVGVKYQPPGSKTLLTAAAFDLRQQNVSVTQGNVTRQVGEVKVHGLELEATSDVTNNLKLVGSYTYTDTDTVKGPSDGSRLKLVPRNAASGWADYTWHNGLLDGFGMGAGVRYVGDTYGNVPNTESGHVGSYTIYDAAVHYDLSRLSNSLAGVSVAVNANNLFNKDYISTCDGFWCYYGDERNVLASVNYKW